MSNSNYKNILIKLSECINSHGKYRSNFSFNCSNRKEREVLEIIYDRMDVEGIGFKAAVIDLLYNPAMSSDDKTARKRKISRQPKITSSKVNVLSSDDEADKQLDTNKNISSVIDSNQNVNDEINKPQEPASNGFTPEAKEALRQKILNSYKLG